MSEIKKALILSGLEIVIMIIIIMGGLINLTHKENVILLLFVGLLCLFFELLAILLRDEAQLLIAWSIPVSLIIMAGITIN